MTMYCVSYDLSQPDRDYPKLYEKIKKYDVAHALESTWFIISEKGAAEIRDDLKKAMDTDDSIIVIEVIKHWASSNIGKGVTDWLKRNL